MPNSPASVLDPQWLQLIEQARLARRRARATFSKFQVGAAVVTPSGAVYAGCNIENASYGLTVCAERVALWKAISEGENEFSRCVVVADTQVLTPPCGACRQLIWEFCGDVPILMANLESAWEIVASRDLLPRAFDAKFL